jgi:hypothetical protein
LYTDNYEELSEKILSFLQKKEENIEKIIKELEYV